MQSTTIAFAFQKYQKNQLCLFKYFYFNYFSDKEIISIGFQEGRHQQKDIFT